MAQHISRIECVRCWGGNNRGQLGDGTLVNTNAPITSLFAGSTTYTPNATHKHAVASLSTGETYSYDANGNTPALYRTYDLPSKLGASVTQRVEGGLTYTERVSTI